MWTFLVEHTLPKINLGPHDDHSSSDTHTSSSSQLYSYPQRDTGQTELYTQQLQQRMLSVLAARFYSNLLANQGMIPRPHWTPQPLQQSGNKSLRKARTVFTEYQLNGLESRFTVQHYLSTPERLDLANSLNLTDAQV